MDCLGNADRRDIVFFVISFLDLTAAVGFVDSALHRIGHMIRIKNHLSIDVPGSPTKILDQGCGGTQETFLIGIQYCHQRDLRQVQPFAQQVDTHDHIKNT